MLAFEECFCQQLNKHQKLMKEQLKVFKCHLEILHNLLIEQVEVHRQLVQFIHQVFMFHMY